MADQMRSAEFLVKSAVETPGVLSALKADPEETLKQLEKQAIQTVPRALEQDKWIYRVIVGSLGAVLILVVIGAIAISFSSKELPDVLTALASASIGALAGILAPSPAGLRNQ